MAEQYNMQTGFIDGSGVYGPNEVNIVEEERGVESFKSFCPFPLLTWKSCRGRVLCALLTNQTAVYSLKLNLFEYFHLCYYLLCT